jgi:hypothetical protein
MNFSVAGLGVASVWMNIGTPAGRFSATDLSAPDFRNILA